MTKTLGDAKRRVVWVLAILLGPAVMADFQLVEDFESCSMGPVDGQNGWIAENSSPVVAPGPAYLSNQVLAVTTNSTWIHRDAWIPDGATRTLFLRFRFADHLNDSFGTSDSVDPTTFDEFASELNVSDALNDLRINNGGAYDTLATLLPDTWYTCWLVIDNFSDVTQVYLHDRTEEDAQVTDLQEAGGQTLFDFRKGTVGALHSFFIKTGGGSGLVGPLYIDDIYLEAADGVNLQNPTASFPPAVPAGRIPSETGLPEQPLLLDKTEGPEIRLSWGASCLAADSDFGIYEGVLGDYDSQQVVVCTTQGVTVMDVMPSDGNSYYLVVPRNAEREGSYGRNSEGFERLQGAPACLPQEIGECP